MTPTKDERPRTGFTVNSDPVLIDRVIQIKRRSRYFAGEGFRVSFPCGDVR